MICVAFDKDGKALGIYLYEFDPQIGVYPASWIAFVIGSACNLPCGDPFRSPPLASVRVQAFHVTFITIEWADGHQRTIATTNSADGGSLGILVKGGATPE